VTTPDTPPRPEKSHLIRTPLLPAIVAGGFGIAIAMIQLYCPSRAEGPCARVARIAVYSPQGDDDPRLAAIEDALDAEDCPVDAVRRESNRRRNEIRYFHPRDRAAAEAVSALLLRSHAADAVPRFLPGEADERPAGLLELWLDRGR
jgi:hypothetical protein